MFNLNAMRAWGLAGANEMWNTQVMGDGCLT